jgi:hypothetical protein
VSPSTSVEESPADVVRVRLGDLDSHLHCSVIGTCLSVQELRRLMARFCDVTQANDLEVHHEAVRLASVDRDAARALHKALDRQHASTLQRFSRVKVPSELESLWDEALHQGNVPAAYWAVLTHRRTTTELRQRAFGDVHMLSHLMGASNRADLRRLVNLEGENTELKLRLERQQERVGELSRERDSAVTERDRLGGELTAARADQQRLQRESLAVGSLRDEIRVLSQAVALQTERRERAEQAELFATQEQRRLGAEIECLLRQARELSRELDAAEAQLRAAGDDLDQPSDLAQRLRGRRVLYVGGRPSSIPSIRGLVERHGGDFQRHDGGLEDRKGLLDSAVAWAQLVVFPVDCVDHDSAWALKRLCLRQGTPFKALRSASVASFAAGVVDAGLAPSPEGYPSICLKNG